MKKQKVQIVVNEKSITLSVVKDHIRGSRKYWYDEATDYYVKNNLTDGWGNTMYIDIYRFEQMSNIVLNFAIRQHTQLSLRKVFPDTKKKPSEQSDEQLSLWGFGDIDGDGGLVVDGKND